MSRLKAFQQYCSELGWPKTFFCVALVQALAVIALEGYIFTKWQIWVTPVVKQVPVSLDLPTNLAIIIFGFVYEVALVYDALRLRNSIQLVAICLQNVALLVYTSLQRRQMHGIVRRLPGSQSAAGEALVHEDMDVWSDIGPVLLAIPIIVGVTTGILGALSVAVIREFSWTTYKQLHGDRIMKHRLVVYQVYTVLLKVDFFVITAFLVLYAVPVLGFRGWESYTDIAFVVVTGLILLTTAYFTKKEQLIGMIVAILCFCAGGSYFVYKMIVIYTDKKIHFMFESSLQQLTLYGSLSIAFLTLSAINGILCAVNSGHGLKQYFETPLTKIESSSKAYTADMSYEDGQRNLARYHPEPRRLVLD